MSYLVTRVVGNMGVAEPTPLLERFSSPLQGTGGEGRWLSGFYLDEPDDPYRYFLW